MKVTQNGQCLLTGRCTAVISVDTSNPGIVMLSAGELLQVIFSVKNVIFNLHSGKIRFGKYMVFLLKELRKILNSFGRRRGAGDFQRLL